MNKKGYDLPINVMIVAALGLTVLVVLFITFTSEAGQFSKNVLTCEAKGGKCMKSQECQFEKINIKCPNKDEICCINPLGETR